MDNMGTRCRTGAKRSSALPPTRWVGDAASSSSGYWCSSALQVPKQPVVLGVGDLRIVQHVIAVIMPVDFGAEFRDPVGGAGSRHGASGGTEG
jgi:hypothetical protein